MTVLIIDEDATVRVWLQHLLPCETRTASSFAAGIREAAEWQPSVVLLDADAVGSLTDAVRAVKAESPRSQIIFMTSAPPTEEMRAAIEAGAYSVAQKGDAKLVLRLVAAARARVSSVFVPSSSKH